MVDGSSLDFSRTVQIKQTVAMDGIRHAFRRGRERLRHTKEKFSKSHASSATVSAVASREGSTAGNDRRASSSSYLRAPTDEGTGRRRAASASTAGPSEGVRHEAPVGRSQLGEEIAEMKDVEDAADSE